METWGLPVGDEESAAAALLRRRDADATLFRLDLRPHDWLRCEPKINQSTKRKTTPETTPLQIVFTQFPKER